MPADYTVTSSHADIQVISPTSVMNVTRFGIRTKPSDVLVMINVPQEKVTAQQAHVSLQAYALLVETAMRTAGVVAAHPEQDTDASGLLDDYMIFTVRVPDEEGLLDTEIQTDVAILTRNFATAAGYAKGVNAALQAAIAGLTSAVQG